MSERPRFPSVPGALLLVLLTTASLSARPGGAAIEAPRDGAPMYAQRGGGGGEAPRGGAAQEPGERAGPAAGRGARKEKPVAKPPKPEVEPPERVLPDVDTWRDWITRDARIRFTPRTGSDARAALAAGGLSIERRSAAWMALGCAGAVGDRSRLEAVARQGTGLESRAAVLALGELAAGDEPLFLALVAKSPPELAECALLALLRSGRPASQRRVEEIAHDPSDPLSKAASELVVFHLDRGSSAPSRAAALLLDLRWEAARKFGLIDGQSWPVLRAQELARDPGFLREVTLRAAARLRRVGGPDHLLSELLAGEGSGRLRAAVTAMPRELQQLVESGLWAPKDESEWREILDQIDELGLEPLTIELLERAAEIESLHYRALAMLSRTGRVPLAGRIDADLGRLPIADRMWALDAVGGSGDAGWSKHLAILAEHESEDLRAAAKVALARLGGRKAEAALTAELDGEDHAEHRELVTAMCRNAGDPLITLLLESHLAEAPDEEALEIATALTLSGRLTARLRVRAGLAADPPPKGAAAIRLVRALRRNGTAEDLEVLTSLFPQPGERDLNIELALALTELGDPSIQPLLRASLWGGSFDQSLLAGGLIAEIAGILSLRAELQRPPVEATSSDVRRVGYAIGAWGGLVQVEGLARELRYNSGHPALQGALLGFLGSRTQ